MSRSLLSAVLMITEFLLKIAGQDPVIDQRLYSYSDQC
ncbi:unnamed protein product [Staurois parvus]|uniref:Uncharacterized protein n=1 Tax=Staurois parvus TaxID=386267 RepID=A0ABN9AXA0_9NEOB|nr:unnamed protein product [Staurois parvus]